MSKQGSEDLYLEPGDYVYPFQCVLPLNLPSSFEHYHGQIRYSVKGTIDIPWALDKHTVKSFTVINNLDLNRLGPNVRQPMEKHDNKNILLSFGGPIIATFQIEKSYFLNIIEKDKIIFLIVYSKFYLAGYVPGEIVRYQATINNTCNRDVIRTRVKLVQYTVLQGSSREIIVKTHHTKKSHHDMAKTVIDKVIAGKTSQTITNDQQPLVIPSVCPTLNGLCQIISVNYALVFTFGVKGSIDKDLIIPITIGTVPLHSASNAYHPPPIYEQSMFGSEGSEKLEFKNDDPPVKGDVYESDANTYRPLYPNFIGFEQFLKS